MTGRLLTGTAAWAVGTAVAVTLSWLGAEVVLRDAVASGPQAPVLGAAAPSPSVSGSPSPAAPSPSSPAPRRTPSPRPSETPRLPSRASPPSSPRPGTIRTYAISGGRVTLLIAKTSAQLVAATPDSGFSVQTWSAAGWLRVDFGQGSTVSSLIATWNGHAPTVQTFTD